MAETTKGRKFKPMPFTSGEIQAMLKACNPRYATGLRSRALILVGYSAGLRVSEALALMPSDVSLSTGEIIVRRGKGGKSRVCYLNDTGIEAVRRWKEIRKDFARKGSPLFCTITESAEKGIRAGDALSTAYVRALMSRIGRKAMLSKRCHFHALRHSFALENALNGTSMHVIKKQLGHASLKTTSDYLDTINHTDLRNVRHNVPELKL